MRTNDQAWTLAQLENLESHLRYLSAEIAATTRQLSTMMRELESRFAETVARERTE